MRGRYRSPAALQCCRSGIIAPRSWRRCRQPAAVEWVVNAYLLVSAVSILLGGEAADRFGPRYASIAGIMVFALASVLIAVAPAGTVVIGARALQGLGAAFAVAGTLAAVTQAASESTRARAISAWTGFLLLGFSIGPLVGGVLTRYAGWRFNFWLNVLAMVPAWLMLFGRRGSRGHAMGAVDWLGFALLAVSIVLLIFGLHALATPGAAPLTAIVLLVLAVIVFAFMFLAETHRRHPLLDFAMFLNRNFALASALIFFLMFDIITFLLYYNLFAQARGGLGMCAVGAGLSLIPLSIALFDFARSAPRLEEAIGLCRMLVGGWLLLAVGCAVVLASQSQSRFAILMLGLFAVGAGVALPYASAPRIGLATLQQTQAGKGSGILNTCSFFGGTVGVTCGGIVFGLAGFSGVLALLGLTALNGAALTLAVRPA